MTFLFLPRFFRPFSLLLLLFPLTLSGCTAVQLTRASEIAPFRSDGCSLFPDGTLADRHLWCDCCQSHDLAYWQGGSAEERQQADAQLQECVQARTGNPQLAAVIYLGVRAGGHPAFPLWYRWGYGWPYGRGYQTLNATERLAVERALVTYRQEDARDYCREEEEKP